MSKPRLVRAFFHSMSGLTSAFRGEPAFRQETILAAVLIPLAIILPATFLQTALLVGAVLAVLVVELLNSAVEAAVDRVSLEEHPLAKRAKDKGSAAVFLTLMGCGLVWLFVLLDMMFG